MSGQHGAERHGLLLRDELGGDLEGLLGFVQLSLVVKLPRAIDLVADVVGPGGRGRHERAKKRKHECM